MQTQANRGKHKQRQAKSACLPAREWEVREARERLAALCKVNKSVSQLFAVDAMWMPCVLVVSLSHSPVAPSVDAKACLLQQQLICAAAALPRQPHRKPTRVAAAASVAVDVAACAALPANSWSAFRFQLVFHCGAARTCLGFARLSSARRSDLEFCFGFS